MKILHVVPGLNEPNNGIAVAAKLIADGQSKSGVEVKVVETRDFVHSNIQTFEHYSEVWVHSMWLPTTLKVCWKVLQLKRANLHSTTTTSTYDSSPRLVRMTHANLDPLRYRYHGWKKRLVAPIERWLFKRTDRVVVTCEAEKKWCQQWGLENEFEILDLKKFFNLDKPRSKREIAQRNLHVLYLGRRHPLKGVEFLERAVTELNHHCTPTTYASFSLRIVSDHFGEELEKDWEWCDVLCLPTLSENFGLVVAEAIERDKCTVTTDGAPAWNPKLDHNSITPGYNYNSRLIYLEGYRDGSDEKRVELLKEALKGLVRNVRDEAFDSMSRV